MNDTVRYIIGVVVVIALVVFGLNFIAGNKANNKVSLVASVASATQAVHNIGDVDIHGGEVVTGFTIKNQGPEDIRILDARTSCVCTRGEVDGFMFDMEKSSGEPAVIPAGGEKTLVAIFDPSAHGSGILGLVTQSLIIRTDSSMTPELTFSFTANLVNGTVE